MHDDLGGEVGSLHKPPGALTLIILLRKNQDGRIKVITRPFHRRYLTSAEEETDVHHGETVLNALSSEGSTLLGHMTGFKQLSREGPRRGRTHKPGAARSFGA